MILTVILVRGIRESARTNNILVLVKMAAILVFIFSAASFIKPHYWHPFMPNGWSGVLDRRLHHLLHLHRLRFRLHRGRGVPQSAARPALRHSGHAHRLHRALRRRGHRAQRHRALAIGDGRRRPGRQRAQAARDRHRRSGQLHWVRLFVLHRRAHGHDLLHPRLSARPGAHLVRHVSRRPAARRSSAASTPSSAPRPSPPGSPDSSSASPPDCSTSAPSPTSPTSAPCSPSFSSPSQSSSCVTASPSAIAASASLWGRCSRCSASSSASFS